MYFHIVKDDDLSLSILSTCCLDEIENLWLQHLKACLMGYNFIAQWTKISKHHALMHRLGTQAMSCIVKTLWQNSPQIQPDSSISIMLAIISAEAALLKN